MTNSNKNRNSSTLADVSAGLADAAETAGKSLVRLRQRRRHGLTGVLVGDGLIATSSRALRSDTDVRAELGDLTLELELVGRDAGTDVALLRVVGDTPESLQAPTWRDDPPRVGELAVAVARPGQTVRAALSVLSVVGGPFRSHAGTQIDHYLELDRDLPRGFSGALLLDGAGRGLGLALPGVLRGVTATLPSATLQAVVAKLQQHGKVPQGYLGVGVYPARLPKDVSDDVGQARGVAVVALEEDGPAASAGLAIGDVIISIEKTSITSPIGLRSALTERSGENIQLKVLRAGKAEDLNVDVGERA